MLDGRGFPAFLSLLVPSSVSLISADSLIIKDVVLPSSITSHYHLSFIRFLRPLNSNLAFVAHLVPPA